MGNALADHPEILFFGEVFHVYPFRRVAEAARATLGAGVVRRLPLGLPVCRDEDDGSRYLGRLFDQGTGFRATGFKLFYHHARSGAVASAWDYLAATPRLKIVHLRRSNWLESLVSLERARMTGTWHATAPQQVRAFCLSPQCCRRYFEDLERSAALVQPLLDTHAVLELEYRQVVAEFQPLLARICAFLDVEPAAPLTARLVKIAQVEPSRELTNYHELRACFRDTPYSRFFP